MVNEADLEEAHIALAQNHSPKKLSERKALKYYAKNEKAIRAETFSSDTVKGIGNKLYRDSLFTIVDAGIGGESRCLIGKDLSTNGLGIWGANTRNKKALVLANLTGQQAVEDAHMEVLDALHDIVGEKLSGLSRDECKDYYHNTTVPWLRS